MIKKLISNVYEHTPANLVISNIFMIDMIKCNRLFWCFRYPYWFDLSRKFITYININSYFFVPTENGEKCVEQVFKKSSTSYIYSLHTTFLW